jgi:hypothetical protein
MFTDPVGAALAAMLLPLFCFAFRSVFHISSKHRGPRIPSGGRVEVLWRGAFGMDAKRGTMGQGWPTVTTLGTAPERGKSGEARPACRARFLFGYFLFRASKEKVTRRKGERLTSWQ